MLCIIILVTERAQHACNYIEEYSLQGIDGIISVGGDGMFSEILNGLLLRTAKDKGIDYNDPSAVLVEPSITLGFIAGGSTDVIAYGSHGTRHAVTAALHIILGKLN